jgi:cobalt-zinc-cadmium resistance protein CzcA
VAVTEHELKKQVTQTFYHWVYLQQKHHLLQFADSLYVIFLNRAELRLAKGESNILEKITAENQLGQINIQLQQLHDDIELTKLRFRYLLNSSDNYLPTFNHFKIDLSTKTDMKILKEHPSMKLLNQQKQIADAMIGVEKNKLLPTLSFLYNNGSIRGTGANNIIYNGWHRFQSIQVGLGIPIFTNAQKAKINSEKVNKLVVENSYLVGLQQLNNTYSIAVGEYNKFLKTVEYYEKSALNNATLIHITAQQQLFNGSINSLEWVTLTNQATAIRNDYIEAVKNLNESIIQINSLINY